MATLVAKARVMAAMAFFMATRNINPSERIDTLIQRVYLPSHDHDGNHQPPTTNRPGAA
jgi:hypothetical protein